MALKHSGACAGSSGESFYEEKNTSQKKTAEGCRIPDRCLVGNWIIESLEVSILPTFGCFFFFWGGVIIRLTVWLTSRTIQLRIQSQLRGRVLVFLLMVSTICSI